MWRVELNFRGEWVRLPGEWMTRDAAEWAVAMWKSDVRMTGDRFRYVFFPKEIDP